jgi:hypothetical protein
MRTGAVDVLGRLDDLAVEAVGHCEVVLFLALEGCGPLPPLPMLQTGPCHRPLFYFGR